MAADMPCSPSEPRTLWPNQPGTKCKSFALAAWAWLPVWLAFVACSRPAGTGSAVEIEAAPQVSAADQAQARAFYDARCAECHGPQGEGDGPKASTLRPRPQRLSDRIWQSNVRNARIDRVLVHGGVAVGKSAVMPASSELADQPALRAALVALIRSFAGR
jgi:mono/diheme cytochrome c family protein